MLTKEERTLVDYYLKNAEEDTDSLELARIISRLTAPEPQQPDSCPPRESGTGVGLTSLPVAEATTAPVGGEK